MEKILEIYKNLWIARGKINELKEQDINPNVMPRTMFDQLTTNIKKRGALESLPLCAEVNNTYEIISGHHRIRAARAAGLDEIFILLDTSGLSRDEIIAKQLAHNNINGTVDPELTLRLFEEIKDIDARLEAYVDVNELLKKIEEEHAKINEIELNFDMKSISILFLPYQYNDFEEAMSEIIKRLNKDEEAIYLASLDQFKEFRDALRKVKNIENIKNTGFALHKMAQIVLDFYKDKDEKKLHE